MLQEANYVDTARKFTVYDLFMFLAEAVLGQWDGEKRMVACEASAASERVAGGRFYDYFYRSKERRAALSCTCLC